MAVLSSMSECPLASRCTDQRFWNVYKSIKCKKLGRVWMLSQLTTRSASLGSVGRSLRWSL